MTNRGKTILRGHALIGEGKPDQDGAGRCECGALSPPLPSDRARQRWHKAHKDDVRRAA